MGDYSSNYSKWNNMWVSDDEDETHINIHTEHLFKVRHAIQSNKICDFAEKNQELLDKIEEHNIKRAAAMRDFDAAVVFKNNNEIQRLKPELEKLEAEAANLQDEQRYLEKEKKLIPLSIDTLSKPGFSNTIINSNETPKKMEEELSEDEKLKRSDKFMEDHWRDIRRYGMLHDYRDSEELLKEKPHLACEDTVDYLLAWCIGLEVEGKRALMERVTHQIVSMQSLLQIAAELELNPRSAAINFFQKMGKRAEIGGGFYMDGFQNQIKSCIDGIKDRARARMGKSGEESDEEDTQNGPPATDTKVENTEPAEGYSCVIC